MESGVFGGGVIFVVAALLWAAVLVPSWVRRREFKSAEQHALRLQRTLRVLAETAEVPTELRVEATAREALAQEKLLRTAQRRLEAERKSELAAARAEQLRAEVRAQQMKRKQAALARAARLRRPVVRRIRSISALVFVLSAMAAFVGIGVMIAGLGPAVLITALALTVCALGALVLLAPGRVKHVKIDIPAQPAQPSRDRAVLEPQQPARRQRTPQEHAAAQAEAAARIARARALARARAERAETEPAQRENQAGSILLAGASKQAGLTRSNQSVRPNDGETTFASEHPSNPATPPARTARAKSSPEAAAVSERIRQMGVVGDTSDGALDLDSVLRTRRRAS